MKVKALLMYFFSIISIIFIEGMANPESEPKVTEYPPGDIELQQCSDNGDPECTTNPRSKSFLVCAPGDNVNGFNYRIFFGEFSISHEQSSTLEYNSEAEKYGATGATLNATSANTNERCKEVLIRFWSIPSLVSRLPSATVNFEVWSPDLGTIYTKTFGISYSSPSTTTTTTTTTTTPTVTTKITTEEANSSETTSPLPVIHTDDGVPTPTPTLSPAMASSAVRTALTSSLVPASILCVFALVVVVVLVIRCKNGGKSYQVKQTGVKREAKPTSNRRPSSAPPSIGPM